MRPAEGTHAVGGNWLSPQQYLDHMLGFKNSCFRFQALQRYTVPYEQESLAEFRRTGTYAVAEGDPVLVQTAGRMSGGRKLLRVQVVQEPISDYLRYAFVFYRHCVRVGEDIRVVMAEQAADLPDHDFVVLDGETVIKLHYSATDGSVVGREVLPVESVEQFTLYQAEALTRSVPFSEYERRLSG